MTQNQAPQQDIISPAEAKFWADWAAKAPGIIRGIMAKNDKDIKAAIMPYTIGGIAVGAVLGGASFTKHIPGKWKWLSGIASAGSFAVSYVFGLAQAESDKMQQLFLDYANALEKDPALQQQLANFLTSTVTADMAAGDMGNVVMERVSMLAVAHERQSLPMGLPVNFNSLRSR
jgi:hypothetical protein